MSKVCGGFHFSCKDPARRVIKFISRLSLVAYFISFYFCDALMSVDILSLDMSVDLLCLFVVLMRRCCVRV